MYKLLKSLALLFPPVKKLYQKVNMLKNQCEDLQRQNVELLKRNNEYYKNEIDLIKKINELGSVISDNYINKEQYYKLIENIIPYIDLSHIKSYYSCNALERFDMIFNGYNGHHVNRENGCLEFCCNNQIWDIPGVDLLGTPEESIIKFVKMRNDIIAESKIIALLERNDSFRNYTSDCAKCNRFKLVDSVKNDGLIHYVNINVFPAPCQCKCIYCEVHNGQLGILDREKHNNIYDRIFNAITYAKDHGMIAADALWQAASGEITINPYKDKILDLIGNNTSRFLSNCFIFDEKIAANLHNNPLSEINLSIDAGTAETWYKVKGVNNFNVVVENLFKYKEICNKPEQITFKYIILPGINDNLDDYNGVMDLMKRLCVKQLIISRDGNVEFSNDKNHHESAIKAAGIFVKILKTNNLLYSFYHHSTDEKQNIETFTDL